MKKTCKKCGHKAELRGTEIICLKCGDREIKCHCLRKESDEDMMKIIKGAL